MTFRLEPELRAQVEQVADDEGCSTSSVIRHALTDLLATRAGRGVGGGVGAEHRQTDKGPPPNRLRS